MHFAYTDSGRLPLKDFRKLAQKNFKNAQEARACIYQNYKTFTNKQVKYDLTSYNDMIISILSLKDIAQHFSSLFQKTSSLPQSIYAIRHSMIKALRHISEQADDLIFQILVLKDVSLHSSKQIIIRQQALRQDLEKLLQDSDTTIRDMRALLDEVSFLENR